MTGASDSLKRRIAAALMAAVALAAAAAASAARPAASPGGKPATAQTNPSHGAKSKGAQVGDQGLVQSVSAGEAVLKALDGSTFTVPVGPRTRVLVDGKLASLRDVKPGFVALVKWQGGKFAQQLAAFDLSAKSGEQLAKVEDVTKTSVSVSDPSGGTRTIHVNVRTRVFVDGKLSALSHVNPGFTLVTRASTPTGGKPAAELLFLTPS